jgi:hypothetical protein
METAGNDEIRMREFPGRETRLRRRWSVGGCQAKKKMLVLTFRTGRKRRSEESFMRGAGCFQMIGLSDVCMDLA